MMDQAFSMTLENDNDDSVTPGLISRVPTHLGDDDYNDDDWTVSTMATTGTASLSDGVPNDDSDHDEGDSSSLPPTTIVTFTLPSSAENGHGSYVNDDDDDGDEGCDNEERVNEHQGGVGNFGNVFQFMNEMSTCETEQCGQAYLALHATHRLIS
jgi:hypothetical protein